MSNQNFMQSDEWHVPKPFKKLGNFVSYSKQWQWSSDCPCTAARDPKNLPSRKTFRVTFSLSSTQARQKLLLQFGTHSWDASRRHNSLCIRMKHNNRGSAEQETGSKRNGPSSPCIFHAPLQCISVYLREFQNILWRKDIPSSEKILYLYGNTKERESVIVTDIVVLTSRVDN